MKSIATGQVLKTWTLHIYRTTCPVDVRLESNRGAVSNFFEKLSANDADRNYGQAIVFSQSRAFMEQDLQDLPGYY